MSTYSVIASPDMPLFRQGKVRDVYDLGDRLLLVATDRLSAFDVVLNETVPNKGRILTHMATSWFALTEDICRNHLISTDVADLPTAAQPHAEALRGRFMLVEKAERVDIECVVRGYLAGSGWKEYQQSQTVCGIPLPEGLRESDQLPEPIFTPAAKNDVGHDQNITFEDMCSRVGTTLARHLRRLSLALYAFAEARARERGVIIADTKFEFGIVNGQVTLIDEILTPDSSRFWNANEWVPGRPQASMDKQPLRDWLETTGWNKQPPPPTIPQDVIDATAARYTRALHVVTGSDLNDV